MEANVIRWSEMATKKSENIKNENKQIISLERCDTKRELLKYIEKFKRMKAEQKAFRFHLFGKELKY